MEMNGNDFLEELLAPRQEIWETMNPLESSSTSDQQFFGSALSFDAFDHYISNPLANFQTVQEEHYHNSNIGSNNCMLFNDVYVPFLDELSLPHITDSSYNTTMDTSRDDTATPFMAREEYPLSLFEEDDPTSFLEAEMCNELESAVHCKLEPAMQKIPEMPGFMVGACSAERKMNHRSKKLQGQPSKNLMAERRRRKRLNDRLSMLRAIVPKISKMDRTSILGDTIDYMKELLEKINNLQQEIEGNSNMEGINFRDAKANHELLVRNSPKFDVERRDVDTRIEICCAGKPGLLLTMVDTLEALGLEIQQCVISCFSDFAMQASCSDQSEELEKRRETSSSKVDIKQALFRNAGYGGRCL